VKRTLSLFFVLGISAFLISLGSPIQADSLTQGLPKEFFDNADMYSKLEMIENLTVLETVTDHDLQVAAQSSTNSTPEAK
jgi:uncharacterized protein Smg (DUF494 family)